MATLFKPPELMTIHQNGVAHTMLANAAMPVAASLQVDRLTLDPGVRTSVVIAPDAECFL